MAQQLPGSIRTTQKTKLTVGFLVSGSGAGTAELLGLVPPGVGYEERPIVRDEDVLDLLLRSLVDVLLVVGDQRLGNGLTNRCWVAEVVGWLVGERELVDNGGSSEVVNNTGGY